MKTWPKQKPCQGTESVKRVQLTIEIRAHARVDKLQPSSFT
jgi:hypothetical protein